MHFFKVYFADQYMFLEHRQEGKSYFARGLIKLFLYKDNLIFDQLAVPAFKISICIKRDGCDDRNAASLTVAAIDSSIIMVNVATFVDKRTACGK